MQLSVGERGDKGGEGRFKVVKGRRS
jgi:hypothetical protein